MGKGALLVHTLHVDVWEEEWEVFIETSSLEECIARVRVGRKSGRYFIEMSSLEQYLLGHSTLTSGKEEWAVV